VNNLPKSGMAESQIATFASLVQRPKNYTTRPHYRRMSNQNCHSKETYSRLLKTVYLPTESADFPGSPIFSETCSERKCLGMSVIGCFYGPDITLLTQS